MTHFPKFHYKIKYLLICYCYLMGKRTKKLALKPKKKKRKETKQNLVLQQTETLSHEVK